MSIQNQRIIYDNGSTETDYSNELCNFRASAVTLPLETTHYIYVGSDLPFNHRYFDIDTANDQASVLSADIWFANAWVAAVDVIDRTSSSGVTFAADGIVEFKINRDKGWDRELDSDDVTGITTEHIYNMYWMRFKISANLAAGTKINYIGHKFAEDSILYTYYPDLNSSELQAAFATGKTDWNDQHFMAAEQIIRDLRAQNIAFSGSQIIDHKLLEEPACHRAASIIYGGMGTGHLDDKKAAEKEYKTAMKQRRFNIDTNGNTRLDDYERVYSTGFATR